MAKTLFGTSDKSNFILNMDLDKFRAGCGKLALILFWTTGISQLLNHMLAPSESTLAQLLENGGFGGVVVFFLLLLRRMSLVFSTVGVFALITTTIGLIRKQFSKATAVPYLLLLASLIWAMISRFHSYDLKVSLLGYSGHEEGWFALLMYAGIFFLGTMLRKKSDLERFARGLLTFGIVQGVIGFLQAIPVIDFLDENKGLNPYRNIEPLLFWNVRIPTGMAETPITYAMLMAMLGAAAVPAALLAEEKKTRRLAYICMFLSVLTALKTQTVAGLIAGFGILLLAVILFIRKRKQATGKAVLIPGLAGAAAVLAVLWVYLTPTVNQAYFHPLKNAATVPQEGMTFVARENNVKEALLPNGFTMQYSKDGNSYPALYDGGLVWDNGYYRVSMSGAYSPSTEHDFEIYDACSVLRYCWQQGVRAVKIDPLLGVGPDNFVYTQLKTSMDVMSNPNSVDNPYNDYLYIAATRGIPSLLMYLALLVICFVLAWKRRGAVKSWVRMSAGGAVVLYAAAGIVGMSVLTVAPVFWMLLGILAADPLAEKEKAETQEKNAKSDKKTKKSQKAK